MAAESLQGRLERSLGPQSLGSAQPFDASNPLHVDRVAKLLLARFLEHDVVEAYGLLLDACQPKALEVAASVAQEIGLAMPHDELVVSVLSDLFVDVRPSKPVPEHFLAWVTDRMRERGEAWVRDFALLDLPNRERKPYLLVEPWVDGSPVTTRTESMEDVYAHVTKICFHRLDVEYRRVLRARDILGLSVEEIAAQDGVDALTARSRLDDARGRLQDALVAAFKEPDS